jgi:trans-aconitate methyltransferase
MRAEKKEDPMINDPVVSADWHEWLRRWDAMQTAYLPYREQRFAIMLDAVQALVGQEFIAVDLASGPGAISQRLLARFPHARCVAVDYDPALLALGRGALGTQDGRLRWVEADLRDPAWIGRLSEERVDAVLSTTALHWLDVGALARVYHQLGGLVRPGGVVLNGDHMKYPPHLPSFRALADWIVERQRAQAFDARGADDWRGWWTAFAQQPGMAPLVAERERRFARGSGQGHSTGVSSAADAGDAEEAARAVDEEEASPIGEVHEAALRDAGFREVGLIWRQPDDGVLLAVR